MVRRDGDIGLGAEARLALAFIEADAERRRVLELPPMRVVCILPDISGHNDALRRTVSMTRERVANYPNGEVRFVTPDDPCRGMRADVVIALRGGADQDVVACLLSDPTSLGIRVIDR